MKNIFWILILFSSQLFAQIKMGITGGVNFPWQHFNTTSPSGNGEFKYKIFTSFQAGLVADIPFSKEISFQPEIVVSGKGGQTSTPGMNNTTASRKIRLYYLEVPLLVNYNIPLKGNKIIIGAGPYVAYGISGKDKHYSDNTVVLDLNAFDGFFKQFDAGLIFQLGFRSKNIQVAALFDPGLANIFNNDNPGLPPGTKVTWKNSMLALSLGYFFRIKK